MPKKHTIDDIRIYIEGNGCKLLDDEYVNDATKISLICGCGDTFKTTFNAFKRGKRQCNKCSYEKASSKNAYSLSYVQNYIEVDSNSGCKLLSKVYINCKKDLKLQCKCGNLFTTTFDQFARKLKSKQQCDECGLKIKKDKLRTSELELKQYVENNSKCKFINKQHTNSYLKITLECECGNIFEVDFNKFKGSNRRQCGICGEKLRRKNLTKTHNKFSNEFNRSEDSSDYILLNKYRNSNTKIVVKHVICGNTYEVLPSNFLKGRRCPYCLVSNGEKKIRKYLIQHMVNYDREYSFDDLFGEGGGLLRFDFAIFDKNNQLQCLIEYDGEFHYIPIMGQRQFEYQKRHDQIKNNYCKKKNIKLIRIPYWDFKNIEKILEVQLGNLLFNEKYKEVI